MQQEDRGLRFLAKSASHPTRDEVGSLNLHRHDHRRSYTPCVDAVTPSMPGHVKKNSTKINRRLVLPRSG